MRVEDFGESVKPPSPDLDVRDAVGALAAGLLALALYVATLQPDLGGPEDTPKFQFLGYVLGTAHPPGYPLYVMLSRLFVSLPIRTIAYRANLFSAVMAAVACGLVYLSARQIGAARWAALCAALGLATGASFWRSAVFAEVYSLAAVMAALAIVFLLAWGARGGAGRLLAAVGAFALGLGNHLTIVGLAPASFLYVFLRNRRVLTVRLVAAAGTILLLGVSQYGFIVLRTHQQAPYLESSATSLAGLARVVTAERYAGQRFAFSPAVVLTEQLPVVLRVMARELGLAGLLMLAAGAFAAVRGRSGGAALLAGAAGGMLAMVINISGDVKGFITPVMVLVWPLTAVGAGAAGRGLEALGIGRRIAGIVAVAAAAAMPAANLAGNYRDADQSHETQAATFLRSVYRQLPDRAGVIAEDYFYDMALHYFMLTREAGPDRGIGPIGFDAASVRGAARGGERRVFAFAGAATFLGAQGLRFERADVAGLSLDSWLSTLRRGTVIVGAAAYAGVPLELSGIGASNSGNLGRARPFVAFARIVGHQGAARREGDGTTSLAVEPAVLGPVLPALPGAVLASADERGARIQLAGRAIAEVDDGLALAVFTPAGSLSRTLELQTAEPMRVPFEEALYELAGETACVEVTTAWTDVSPVLASGSWIATLPALGSVAIDVECSQPHGLDARAGTLLEDGVARARGFTGNAGGDVLTVDLERTGERRPLFRLALDRPALAARARVRAGGARPSVTLCAHEPRALFRSGRSVGVLRPDFESEAYFGAGWGQAERSPAGPVRHGEHRATLLLPLETGYSYRVSLDLVAAPGSRIDVAINETPVGSCEMRDGARCELDLPPGAVRNGVNALTFALPPPPAAPERHGHALTFHGARIDRRLAR